MKDIPVFTTGHVIAEAYAPITFPEEILLFAKNLYTQPETKPAPHPLIKQTKAVATGLAIHKKSTLPERYPEIIIIPKTPPRIAPAEGP